MKRTTLLLLVACIATGLHAQMHVKKYNMTFFRTEEKSSSPLLSEQSSLQAKQHPEYSVLPYNAQCKECVELIDKRTIDSRLFIDPKNAGHTYSQQSHFPLHYQKSAGDIWRTIDPRLRPQGNGVYLADRQPVPAKCDLNRMTTSLNERGFEFEFNKHLSLYFFDDNTLYTQQQPGNYSNYTIGEEGLNVKNIWPGIEMEQLFTAGQVKTNFIIAAPLQIPITKGWMVIEDHFTLPANTSILEEPNAFHTPEGYYRGDYLLKNEKGETLITYGKPVYLDAKVFGMPGVYNLLRNGNDYTLQMLIPVEWLNKPDNTYPLMIDPSVFGLSKKGDFTQSGNPSASLAFTSMALGACDYHLQVQVPGKSQITNAYVDVEYTLTYDNTCGAPPLPPPFCTFSQVSMEVLCDACSTTTGQLSCNPASPPFTGTCTTDSNLVPGANGILVTDFVPNYLACFAPQCNNYLIDFTLKNRDSICGDVCGYLCARGNMWQMTVEALQVDASVTSVPGTVCPGDAVTLTGSPQGGLPPYTFTYSMDNGITFDTAQSATWTVYPQETVGVIYLVQDFCSFSYVDTINVNTYPRPVITISNDTLYSSTGITYQWFLDGNALPGDTFRTLAPPAHGYYTVEVRDGFGCLIVSSSYAYKVTAIAEVKPDGKLLVIPNPSDGNFMLRLSGADAGGVTTLRILDMSGRLIEVRNNIQFSGNNVYTFNPEAKMAYGVYMLELEIPSHLYREKVLITR